MTRERDQVYNKYGGKCAYCGNLLGKRWHIDHLEPVHRVNKLKTVYDEAGFFLERKFVFDKYMHPERDSFSNKMPACASCNINKGSYDLESWRRMIKKYIENLNNLSTPYKMAKRFGLIEEKEVEVKFYFEIIAGL